MNEEINEINEITEVTEDNIENINVDGIIEPNENFVADDVKEDDYEMDQTPTDIDDTILTPETIQEGVETIEEGNKVLEVKDEEEKEELATEMLKRIYNNSLSLESYTNASLALEGLIDNIKRALTGGMKNIDNVLEVYESKNIDISNMPLETQEVFGSIYKFKYIKDLLLSLAKIYFLSYTISKHKVSDPKKACMDSINTIRAYFDNNAKGVFYKTADLFKYSVEITKYNFNNEELKEIKNTFNTINIDMISDVLNGKTVLKELNYKDKSVIKINIARYKILKEFIKDVKEFIKEAEVIEMNFNKLDDTNKQIVYQVSSVCSNVAAGLGKLVKQYNQYN